METGTKIILWILGVAFISIFIWFVADQTEANKARREWNERIEQQRTEQVMRQRAEQVERDRQRKAEIAKRTPPAGSKPYIQNGKRFPGVWVWEQRYLIWFEESADEWRKIDLYKEYVRIDENTGVIYSGYR